MRKTLITLFGFVFALILIQYGCKHEPQPYIPDGGGSDTTKCDTSNITYPGTIYPILDDHCIFCHSGANPTGGLDFTNYDQLAFVAQSGALLGAIRHEQGYVPMPKDGDQLDSCSIRQFEIWLRDTTFTPPADTSHPCDPDTAYFEMDVLPILNSSCAKSGCHDAITAQEGIRLFSYDAVMASGVINPGNPNSSELYKKITETDPGDIMPPPPDAPLAANQIEIIRKWIAQGAQNLYCDEMCDTTNVTFSGLIWPEIINNYCTGCHSGTNASGGIHLENHSQVAAQAAIAVGQPGSLWGAVNHAVGNSAMPKNQPQLSDCKLAQIRKWINDGTPNN